VLAPSLTGCDPKLPQLHKFARAPNLASRGVLGPSNERRVAEPVSDARRSGSPMAERSDGQNDLPMLMLSIAKLKEGRRCS
jgi:hypothetical protein